MKNSVNKQLNILSITSKSLKEGALRGILPECYDLSSAVENNPWHKNQNVFDHVVGVFEGLEKVLMFEFLDENSRDKVNSILQEKVEKHSRREILIVATILHDIAKAHTLIKNEKTGMTACPGHEMIGSYLSHEMGKRFGLSGKSIDQLQAIILYHGFVHEILTLSIRKGQQEKYFNLSKKMTRNCYIELLILAYADMLGCDLPRVNPQDFVKREELIIAFLRSSL